MSVRAIIDAVLEPDMELLRAVMDVLRRTARQHSNLPPAEFAAVVNPELEAYGVEMDDGTDKLLADTGALAGLQDNGWIMLSAMPRSSVNAVERYRAFLLHELVHREQYAKMGDKAGAVLRSVEQHVMPDNKVDAQKYMANYLELMAYAKSYVDDLQRRGLDKEAILAELRKGRFDLSRFASMYKLAPTFVKHKLLRYAAAYVAKL